MGRRGPKPTPKAVLRVRGSYHAGRHEIASSVDGPDGLPDCPVWLDVDAKAAWRQLVPMLESMGVLTRIDGNLLTKYCRLWSRWKAAEMFLIENGQVKRTKRTKGTGSAYPEVKIALGLAGQLLRMEQEMGLTPSARTRIRRDSDSKKTENAKDRFFRTG